jgi:hypothetical protein
VYNRIHIVAPRTKFSFTYKVGRKMEAITIEVDELAAKAYRASPPEDRRRLERLLSMRLTEYLRDPASLEETMRQMSRQATERGVTQKNS